MSNTFMTIYDKNYKKVPVYYDGMINTLYVVEDISEAISLLLNMSPEQRCDAFAEFFKLLPRKDLPVIIWGGASLMCLVVCYSLTSILKIDLPAIYAFACGSVVYCSFKIFSWVPRRVETIYRISLILDDLENCKITEVASIADITNMYKEMPGKQEINNYE